MRTADQPALKIPKCFQPSRRGFQFTYFYYQCLSLRIFNCLLIALLIMKDQSEKTEDSFQPRSVLNIRHQYVTTHSRLPANLVKCFLNVQQWMIRLHFTIISHCFVKWVLILTLLLLFQLCSYDTCADFVPRW